MYIGYIRKSQVDNYLKQHEMQQNVSDFQKTLLALVKRIRLGPVRFLFPVPQIRFYNYMHAYTHIQISTEVSILKLKLQNTTII